MRDYKYLAERKVKQPNTNFLDWLPIFGVYAIMIGYVATIASFFLI